MNIRLIFNRFEQFRFLRIRLLQLFWGIGLLVGIYISLLSSGTATLAFESAFAMRPSLVYLVLVTALPIVLISIALRCRWFILCYPMVFLEALCRGFCGMMVFCVFGSGAWLMRLLFMFSASCGSILMWWLLFRQCRYKANGFSNNICLVLCLTFVFIMVDYLMISPFLIRLSMYF